jgi:hypothetical protein
MKKNLRFTLLSITILAAYVLSACGGAAPAVSQPSSNPSSVDAPKVLAVEVAFSGTVESMNGNQWVVDGKTVTVDPQTAADVVQVGDLVRVQGKVNQDGTVASTRVQNALAPSAGAPAAAAAGFNPGGYPDPTQTPPPSTGGEGEIFGVIEAMTDTTVTIGGVVYQLTNFSEVKGLLGVGVEVKIHFVTNPDGTLTIREIELRSSGGGDGNANGNSNANENGNGNGNDNTNVNGNGNGNGNDDNTNVNDNGNGNDDHDDNGNANSNDHGNGNEDHDGGNGNDNGGRNGNGNGNGDD